MPEIMSLFIYQSSRRQLLADLLHRFDEVSKKKEDLSAHKHEGDEKAQQEHDAAGKHAENLINAVHAADDQVKKLEFWSDIKVMALHGDLLTEAEGGNWDLSKWQGLTSPTSPEADHPRESFKNKQKASEGVKDLHPHPEHDELSKEEEKDAIPGERKRSMPYWDAQEYSDSTQGAYSTAAESASQLSRKGSRKGKGIQVSGLNLDGVAETDEDPPSPTTADEPSPDLRLPNTPHSLRKKSSVQIVEPVPEPDPSSQVGGGS